MHDKPKECFGIMCKSCDAAIVLGVNQGLQGNRVTFISVPVSEIECGSCKAKHLYGREDLTNFPCPEFPQWISG